MTSLGMCSLFYSSITTVASSSQLPLIVEHPETQMRKEEPQATPSAQRPSFNRSVSLMTSPRLAIQRYLFGMHMKTKRCLAEEAESGDETSVYSWISEGCDPNELDNYGYTPLLNAAALGRLNAVMELVKNGADVNKVGPYGYTPIHAAAQNGHREIVAFLLSNGANINAQNDDMDTPIHLALSAYRIEIVFMLLSNGGNVRIKGFNKKDCIECARDLRLLDIADRLQMSNTSSFMASHTQSTPAAMMSLAN